MSSRFRGPAFAHLRRGARYVVENHVDRPIVHTRRAKATLTRNARALLHMGDSSMLHISPNDSDLRRLGEMMADETGLGSAQFFGPGYSPALFDHMVRLAATRTPPTCAIVSLGLRTSTHRHVVRHPVFGYERSIDILGRAKSIDSRALLRAPKLRPSDAQYSQFEKIARRSRWGLASTVGEYRTLLRGYDPRGEGDERQAVLYDYFHGEFTDGAPGLDDWRALGARLKALTIPVIAYRSWMPVDNGVRLLGSAFRDHVEHNFELIEAAFFDGLGGGRPIPLDALDDGLFVNPADGTEHLNERGRRRVVDTVAPAVLQAID